MIDQLGPPIPRGQDRKPVLTSLTPLVTIFRYIRMFNMGNII